jgi:hypothetical protein
MRWKQCRPSGDWEIPSRTMSCGAVSAISSPSKRIEPCRGGVRPETDRSVVDALQCGDVAVVGVDVIQLE